MRRRIALWLLVLAGWTVIAVVFAMSSSLTYAITYQPPQWGRTFGLAFAEWYAWAAVTPILVWASRRFRLTRTRWARRLLILGVLATPVVLLKTTITRLLIGAAGVSQYVLITNIATQYFIYWGVVVAVHALDNYQSGRERELRASQLEASLAAARVQLLTMQLQPHFLFNTLNAISELIHENPRVAERMIGGLSQLLRETLDAGLGDVVPLGRELELLGCYIDIQRTRFGNRLDVAVTTEEGTEDALVPRLLLQPLVENAIKHGIAARRDAGRIAITAARQDADRLVIEVEDDGAGFDSAAAREGVGLGNTKARLQALYGARHTFDVTAIGGGTRVRITIPWPPEAGQA